MAAVVTSLAKGAVARERDGSSRGFALSDNPQDEDLLGYMPYVNAMAGVLSGQDLQTPFTVGIYGRWGTGKSTFMHLLRKQLEAESLECFTFHPWQFDQKDDVWKALILTVLQYLDRRNRQLNSQPELQAARITQMVKDVVKLTLDVGMKSLSGGEVSLEKLTDIASKASRENANFTNQFRAKFEDLRNDILRNKLGERLDADISDRPETRLVVFVDDLDRCSPENSVMVLEAIKLFFDVAGCVFVLGIDREIVQSGIDLKYRRIRGIRGQDYLEKMVQLPFSLPPIQESRFQAYVRNVTSRFGFEEDTILLLSKASDGNPRQVKRIANSLQLIRTVAAQIASDPETPDLTRVDERKLAFLLVLQVRFPQIFGWLNGKPATFTQISSAWQETARSEVIQCLEGAFSVTAVTAMADNFYNFIQHALQTLSIPDFDSPAELAAYLRITGVVRESKAPPRSVTLRETVDDPLKTDDKAPPGPGMDDEQDLQDRSDTRGRTIDWAGFDSTAREVISKWASLRGRGPFNITLANISAFSDDLAGTVAEARTLIANLRGITTSAMPQQVLSAVTRLGEITIHRAGEQLMAVARLLRATGFFGLASAILVWLLAMGLEWQAKLADKATPATATVPSAAAAPEQGEAVFALFNLVTSPAALTYLLVAAAIGFGWLIMLRLRAASIQAAAERFREAA
jgi:hypothetical protein